jgi:hypothetical protein
MPFGLKVVLSHLKMSNKSLWILSKVKKTTQWHKWSSATGTFTWQRLLEVIRTRNSSTSRVTTRKVERITGKPKAWRITEETQVHRISVNEEIKILKVSNPVDWFLTTKTVPPKSYLEISFDECLLMKKFQEKEARAVKAVWTEVTKNVVATVVVVNVEFGTQLGPKLTLVNNQPSTIITNLNQIGDGSSLVLTTPTVQFGCAVHLTQDVEKKGEWRFIPELVAVNQLKRIMLKDFSSFVQVAEASIVEQNVVNP